MAIPITIASGDIRIAFDLMSMDGSLRPGSEITTPGGATLRFNGVAEGSGGRAGERLEFELSRARTAEVQQLAGWLYERLKGRVPTVRVGRSEVRVDPRELERALANAARHE